MFRLNTINSISENYTMLDFVIQYDWYCLLVLRKSVHGICYDQILVSSFQILRWSRATAENQSLYSET